MDGVSCEDREARQTPPAAAEVVCQRQAARYLQHIQAGACQAARSRRLPTDFLRVDAHCLKVLHCDIKLNFYRACRCDSGYFTALAAHQQLQMVVILGGLARDHTQEVRQI